MKRIVSAGLGSACAGIVALFGYAYPATEKLFLLFTFPCRRLQSRQRFLKQLTWRNGNVVLDTRRILHGIPNAAIRFFLPGKL